MPIIDVELVTAEPVDSGLARRLADAIGAIFEGPPGSTWVKVRLLPPHLYAENETGSPEGRKAVFVTVLKARRPEGEALEAEVRILTESIARVCRRPPENVHILYEPDAHGRIAFGGNLIS